MSRDRIRQLGKVGFISSSIYLSCTHHFPARWFQKHPLHLSASSSALTYPVSPSEPLPMSESYILPAEAAQSSSFTTAFAMLLYNVTYLAHTQSVEVPLSQAGEVLSNLWAVCCSPDLGRYVPVLPISVLLCWLTRRTYDIGDHTKRLPCSLLRRRPRSHLTSHSSYKPRLPTQRPVHVQKATKAERTLLLLKLSGRRSSKRKKGGIWLMKWGPRRVRKL